MTELNAIIIFAIFLFLTVSLVLRFLEETREFQQLGYYMGQYLKHRKTMGIHADHLFYFASAGLLCFKGISPVYSLVLSAVSALFQVMIGRGFKPKHPLAYTNRIIRLLITSAVLFAAAPIAIWYFTWDPHTIAVAYLAAFAAAPLLLLIANLINRPMELAINEKYYRQAKTRVASAPFLKIAAITGSYGKTSIKNILGDMLSRDFNTLVPPSSFNTKLGLTKVIRADLIPTTEVFIAEMGAKKRGEIKETVDMLTPDISFITTVVGQHLETFGSIEHILAEKSWVYRGLKQGGTAIVNCDDEKLTRIPLREDVKVLYLSAKGRPEHANCLYVENFHVHERGSEFTLVDSRDSAQERRIDMHTPLLGEHNIFNILAAAAFALELGAKPEHITAAVERLEPVKNRLSVRKEAGVTVLEDAFNSNPIGAKAALNVLSMMPTDGKRVIITPGMIELGKEKESIHRQFGRQIAEVCDEVILVTRKQTEHIYEGLTEAGFDRSKITVVSGMREALKLSKRICQNGDIVLIENDLPDAFEEVL